MDWGLPSWPHLNVITSLKTQKQSHSEAGGLAFQHEKFRGHHSAHNSQCEQTGTQPGGRVLCPGCCGRPGCCGEGADLGGGRRGHCGKRWVVKVGARGHSSCYGFSPTHSSRTCFQKASRVLMEGPDRHRFHFLCSSGLGVPAEEGVGGWCLAGHADGVCQPLSTHSHVP